MTAHDAFRPEEIQLRPASSDDAYALWLWANDPDTRAASFARDPIEWRAHVAWLANCLRSHGHLILIASLPSGQPVGVVRFDSADGWQSARLSYAVAPEMRGCGIGRTLVASGVTLVRDKHHAVAIRADVRSQNAPSLRVFRRAGWLECVDTGARDSITFWLR